MVTKTSTKTMLLISQLLALLFCCVFSSHSLTIDKSFDNDSLSVGDIKKLTLSIGTIYQFTVISSSSVPGIIFQLHSRYHVIRISKSHDFSYGQTAEGSDVGLWDAINSTLSNHTYYYANVTCPGGGSCDKVGVSVLAAVTSIENGAPLPGGCTLVSPLDTDPNLQLSFTSYTTTVTFQDGNQGYNLTNYLPPECTQGSGPVYPVTQLQYTIYRKQLPTEDYDNDTYFNAMEDVIRTNNLKSDYDLPHATKDSNGIKTITFDSFSGDGAIYVITVTSLVTGKTSTYVPKLTYACDLSLSTGMCSNARVTLVNIISSVLLCGLGLILCFLSHRLFHLEVILFSWVSFSYLLFMLDTGVLSESHTVRVSIAIAGGLVLSMVPFIFWFFSGWYLPMVFIFSGSGGFLLAATALYSPIGSYVIFQINFVYGLFLACFIVLVLIPTVIFPRAMNIITSSFIGGYLVIFAVGMFIFTTLDEIVLKVVKIAALGSGYLNSKAVYPFVLNDIILASAWAVLMILGIIIQAVLARKRDPFPKPSLYKKLTNKQQRRRGGTVEERRRLLSSYCHSPNRLTPDYGNLQSENFKF